MKINKKDQNQNLLSIIPWIFLAIIGAKITAATEMIAFPVLPSRNLSCAWVERKFNAPWTPDPIGVCCEIVLSSTLEVNL